MIKKLLIIMCLICFVTYESVAAVTFASDKESVIVKDTGKVVSVQAGADFNFTCKSCILMEASTKTVIYEKMADERLSPASITKIMTLLLIFEALETGQINLDDEVITSSYAKSMGGSQVFLEEGEKQTVDTLIKCIVVASGNDASVAMAEHIAGSEAEFVSRMNARAKELGMNNTNFEDCCGLSDSDNHYTSAKDVAVMSRELIVNHKEIFNYSTIWMDEITHTANNKESQFGLANTNKLLKQYPYTTGLKTGSTSKAKYCVSATAKKDDIELIAVVMAAQDYKVRFSEAESLLKYGYSVCRMYKDDKVCDVKVPLKGGVKDEVSCSKKDDFVYVKTDGTGIDNVEKKLLYKELQAPVKRGDKVGEIVYSANGEQIGKTDIISNENVEKAGYIFSLKKLFCRMLL